MKVCPVDGEFEEPFYPPRKARDGKYYMNYRCLDCGHTSREEFPRFIVEASIDRRSELIFYVRDNELGRHTHRATPNAPDGFTDKALAQEMADEWNKEAESQPVPAEP